VKEREPEQGEGQRKRENLQKLPTERGALRGAQSHDPEIMTLAKIKSWMLNWINHPGTPKLGSNI